MNEIHSNSELISRLRSSDSKAFSETFQAYHRVLINYARQITGDGDAAYDVVQEVFGKLWEMRNALDSEKSLRALLYKMVRNKALNNQRTMKSERAMRESLQTEAHRHETPEDDLSLKRLREAISSWIAGLPERQREAFQLSRFEGLEHAEIAEIMGLQKRTVTNHIMLALGTIRDQLEIYQTESS